jgi:hypothetical protein
VEALMKMHILSGFLLSVAWKCLLRSLTARTLGYMQKELVQLMSFAQHQKLQIGNLVLQMLPAYTCFCSYSVPGNANFGFLP